VKSHRIALPKSDSEAQSARHRQRVAPFAEDALRRRASGESNPVWDFLFTYYSFRPGKLLTWVPALVDPQGNLRDHASTPGTDLVFWDLPALPHRVARMAEYVAGLCQRILDRPNRFTCFGLHEWAMVYRSDPDEIRHRSCSLRLSPADLDRFVEGLPLQCTHYDAYRFFTTDARPLNAFQPDLPSRPALEQGGCLHANMDLYKWSAKLWPWIGSNLVGECFALAAHARAVDMRASPYDLRHLGFEPIPIEAAAGREQYLQEQQRIAQRARPLRERLLRAATSLAVLAGD
jgi:hypothetical protein